MILDAPQAPPSVAPGIGKHVWEILTQLGHPVARPLLARRNPMNIVYERCAGLDVHKRSVTACAITPDERGQQHKEREGFSTMTPDVLRLRQWLTARGVTHVALESTGVYWQPIWNQLEGHVELLLVNAQHIKAVPGRKTDTKDAGATRSA